MTEHAGNSGNGKGALIRTVGLRKVYTTEEVETTALDNVNLEIADGEFAAIMGPSGCGKSTLLNLLGLLDNPTGGEYWLLEEEVSTYSERLRANLRVDVYVVTDRKEEVLRIPGTVGNRHIQPFRYQVPEKTDDIEKGRLARGIRPNEDMERPEGPRHVP